MWPESALPLDLARLFHVAKRSLLLLLIFILFFGLTFGCLVYVVFLVLIRICRINLPNKENHDAVIRPKTEKSPPNDFQVAAHRGAGFDAPENTIEAIQKAHENGACAIEVDITFTKDGIPAIIHDDTVDRTTDGTGNVGSFTMAELKELNAAAKHQTKHERVTIPTLEEVIKECLRLDLRLYLDCKGVLDMKKWNIYYFARTTLFLFNREPRHGMADIAAHLHTPAHTLVDWSGRTNSSVILEMFKKYPELYQKAAVCSFFPNLIYWLHRQDPNIVVGLTHRELFMTYLDDYVTPKRAKWMTPFLYIYDKVLEWSLFAWVWYVCGNSLWLMHTGHVTRNFINEWRKYGIDTVIWVPNDKYQRAYFGEYLKCPVIVDSLDKNYSDKKNV